MLGSCINQKAFSGKQSKGRLLQHNVALVIFQLNVKCQI